MNNKLIARTYRAIAELKAVRMINVQQYKALGMLHFLDQALEDAEFAFKVFEQEQHEKMRERATEKRNSV